MDVASSKSRHDSSQDELVNCDAEVWDPDLPPTLRHDSSEVQLPNPGLEAVRQASVNDPMTAQTLLDPLGTPSRPPSTGNLERPDPVDGTYMEIVNFLQWWMGQRPEYLSKIHRPRRIQYLRSEPNIEIEHYQLVFHMALEAIKTLQENIVNRFTSTNVRLQENDLGKVKPWHRRTEPRPRSWSDDPQRRVTAAQQRSYKRLMFLHPMSMCEFALWDRIIKIGHVFQWNENIDAWRVWVLVAARRMEFLKIWRQTLIQIEVALNGEFENETKKRKRQRNVVRDGRVDSDETIAECVSMGRSYYRSSLYID